MIIDEINELNNSGKLKKFVACGIIPVKIKTYYEIYKRYNQEMKKCNSCVQSVTNTAEMFNVGERTVYIALKTMKQE